ncbi:MAG TPA: flagellar basal body rod protein FlgB, partial [candidate division Zixibacteria bacterium]|nr:flagellar basal body rod protein FlgB [candidate division Zixibacteria bacterium]
AIQQVLFDQTAIPRLERALDLTSARHKLLAQNVANAETPGYVRQDIDFQSELRSAMNGTTRVGMKVTRPGHINSAGPTHTYRVERQPAAKGENHAVQLDQEMAQQAQNQLEFKVSAHLARGKFEALKTAIRGRR